MAARPLRVLRFLVLASLLLPPLVAQAGSGAEIGDARTIVSLVKADFEKEERDLEVGDVVRQDEVIEVSNDGRGEFRLNDDTKLALGPGARMVLDKFVYDSDKKSGSIIVDLTKGAFRFITGVASKKTYEIRTPNASITVRGTIFDVYVLPDKSAWLLLHEGAIEVTSPKKDVCRVLDQAGQLIRIDSKANVSDPLNWKDMPGRDDATFEDAFPFVVSAPQIEPLPPTSRDGILEAAFPKADNKKCINGLKAKPIKADDDDKPTKKKKPKTRQATNDDAPKKRRPKPVDDDDYGGGARGIDIIIKGGGIGGFGGGRPGGNNGGGYDGGGYGGRGR